MEEEGNSDGQRQWEEGGLRRVLEGPLGIEGKLRVSLSQRRGGLSKLEVAD